MDCWGSPPKCSIFSRTIGGLLFGRETEVASEVWVRQMTNAPPIVETGQAAFDCHGQPSQLVCHGSLDFAAWVVASVHRPNSRPPMVRENIEHFGGDPQQSIKLQRNCTQQIEV